MQLNPQPGTRNSFLSFLLEKFLFLVSCFWIRGKTLNISYPKVNQ